MKTPPWTIDSLARQIEGTRPGRGASLSIDVETLGLLISDARELRSLATLAQAVGSARVLTTALDDVIKNANGLVALLDAARRESDGREPTCPAA